MIVRVLGLDPGTRDFGWNILEGNAATGEVLDPIKAYGTFHTEKWIDKGLGIAMSNRDRNDIQVSRVAQVIRDHQVTHVAMEDFVYMGGRGDTPAQMVALVENLRVTCRALGVHCEIYTNGLWKQILMKCRTANKNQVSHYITRQLKLDAAHLKKIDPGNHIRDAIAIGYCRFRFLAAHSTTEREAGDHAEHGNRTHSDAKAPSAQRPGNGGAGNARGNAVASFYARSAGRGTVRRK